jgi:hypothetical protein
MSDAVARWDEGSEEMVQWFQEKADAFAVTAQGGWLTLPDAPPEG